MIKGIGIGYTQEDVRNVLSYLLKETDKLIDYYKRKIRQCNEFIQKPETMPVGSDLEYWQDFKAKCEYELPIKELFRENFKYHVEWDMQQNEQDLKKYLSQIWNSDEVVRRIKSSINDRFILKRHKDRLIELLKEVRESTKLVNGECKEKWSMENQMRLYRKVSMQLEVVENYIEFKRNPTEITLQVVEI
jgi:hypothetical protein